jgi:anti-anti-sigma factor
MTVVSCCCADTLAALCVEDGLRAPVGPELRRSVRTLLSQGDRDIVLDLTRVSEIDAAGVGELVRAYNLAAASEGGLRIMCASPWVREMLHRAGLFELLSVGPTTRP